MIIFLIIYAIYLRSIYLYFIILKIIINNRDDISFIFIINLNPVKIDIVIPKCLYFYHLR